MLQLTAEEFAALRLQAASNGGHGARRYTSYGFTEHDAIMAAHPPHQPSPYRNVSFFDRLREHLEMSVA